MGTVPCDQAQEVPGCFWNFWFNPSCCGSFLELCSCSLIAPLISLILFGFFFWGVPIQGLGSFGEGLDLPVCSYNWGEKKSHFPINNSSSIRAPSIISSMS